MKRGRTGVGALLVAIGCSSGPGTGDAPAPASCQDLAAVGVWEKVSPPGNDFTYPLTDPSNTFWRNQTIETVVRPDNQAVISGTLFNGLFMSTDCGAHWTYPSQPPEPDGLNWVAARPYLSLSNPDLMYRHQFQGHIFRSEDGGKHWALFGPEDLYANFLWGFINNLHPSLTNPKHLVITSHTQCVANAQGEFWWGEGCFIETKDGGQSWHMGKGPANWSEGTSLAIINDNWWVWGTGTIGDRFYQTMDGGSTWEAISNPATHAPYGGGSYGIVYASPSGWYYATSAVNGILRTRDGASWEQIPNSPNCVVLIGDGKNLFCSFMWHRDAIFEVAESALSNTPSSPAWRQIYNPSPMPGDPDSGAVSLAYDSVHKLLYAARGQGGLWRMRVE